MYPLHIVYILLLLWYWNTVLQDMVSVRKNLGDNMTRQDMVYIYLMYY